MCVCVCLCVCVCVCVYVYVCQWTSRSIFVRSVLSFTLTESGDPIMHSLTSRQSHKDLLERYKWYLKFGLKNPVSVWLKLGI